MNTRDVQTALKAAGFDPGPIDGVRGRQTIAATKAFQQEHKIQIDGIVGPKTIEALFGKTQPKSDLFEIPASMPWVQTAFELIGTREMPGKGSNEAIRGWAHDLEITSYSDDDIPWCGLFVGHCVGSQLPDENLPNNPLGARQWEKFGAGTSPQLGAILVFWRGSRTSGKGHVGFYWAEDAESYHVLGGNQSNAVTIARLAKDRMLQARWPKTAPEPNGIKRSAEKNGKLSVGEA